MAVDCDCVARKSDLTPLDCIWRSHMLPLGPLNLTGSVETLIVQMVLDVHGIELDRLICRSQRSNSSTIHHQETEQCIRRIPFFSPSECCESSHRPGNRCGREKLNSDLAGASLSPH